MLTLLWRHNGHDCVQITSLTIDCLLNCLFGRRSKKTSKLRVTGLCVRNSPGTGEFPAQMASNAENASIWWRHHESGFRYARRSICVLYPKLVPNTFRHLIDKKILYSCRCNKKPENEISYYPTCTWKWYIAQVAVHTWLRKNSE